MKFYEYYSIINSYQIEDSLCENLINEISFINKEPYWVKSFRMNSFYFLKKLKKPIWGNFFLKNFILNKSSYYNFYENTKNNFVKNLYNKVIKKNTAMDFIYNSISVKTSMQKKLISKGIVFCSINDAIKNFPFLVKKYLGSVVKPYDNFFSCLNSSIFSDGTFVYIPKNTICPIELSSYFRINDEIGQFERTLIICEENSFASYLEGCTASIKKKLQLHSAVVEIIVKKNSVIKYSTIQNWYSGNFFNKNGIYNFVTKRGLCFDEHSNIIWIQVETGSSITWKYPSCILKGNFSNGEFYSISISNNYQQIDTGTKMIYFGNECKSYILSKSIALDNSFQTYRGIIKTSKNSKNSKNLTACDSFILKNANVYTFPINIINGNKCYIEHEANIIKITFDEIFFLKTKGLLNNEIYSVLINNFCCNIIKKLPLEFYYEINDLLNSIINYSII